MSMMTLAEFLKRNRLSRSRYYKLRKEGRGPRETRYEPDGKIWISDEAEVDFKHEREAESLNRPQATPRRRGWQLKNSA